jgi:hypothetical protein
MIVTATVPGKQTQNILLSSLSLYNIGGYYDLLKLHNKEIKQFLPGQDVNNF